MKKTTLLTLIIVISNTVAFGQFTNQVSGTTENLNKVFFTSNNVGFVVGDNGTILKTTNSGNNWKQINSTTTESLTSLYFVNDRIGFIVGKNGVLLKSTDSGDTWQEINTGLSVNFETIAMLDEDIGFIGGFGAGYGIIKTTDGGASWNAANLPAYGVIGGWEIIDIKFPSKDVGFATHPRGVLKASIDNGIYDYWSVIKDEWSSDYDSDNELSSCFMLSETKGYFVSANPCGIYATSNSGVDLDYNCIPVNTINFPSEEIGYSLYKNEEQSSLIRKTIDAGTTWEVIYQPGDNTILNDMYFTSDATGWIVGNNGIITKYADATLTTDNFNGIENQISIHPNPSSSLINIDVHDATSSIEKVSLYNSIGSLVLEKVSSLNSISIENFSQGVYFLKIETNKGSITKKIIRK